MMFLIRKSCPTVCVRGAGAVVNSAWEQKKLEARKLLDAKRAADRASELPANIAHPKRMSAGAPQHPMHTLLGAVGLEDSLAKNRRHYHNPTKFLHTT